MSKIRSKVPALLEGKTFSLDDTAYSEKEVYNKETLRSPKREEIWKGRSDRGRRFSFVKPKYVHQTIGASSIEDVKLPHNVELEEWLANHTVEAFNQLVALYGTLCDHCTEDTCPTMCAGAGFRYAWRDGVYYRKATELPAPDYIVTLFEWAEAKLTDPKLFPTKSGAKFHPDILKELKQILKRLFRVYAHLYHSHFTEVRKENMAAALNSCFKYFILFSVVEFNLIRVEELEPMKDLLMAWKLWGKIVNRNGKEGKKAEMIVGNTSPRKKGHRRIRSRVNSSVTQSPPSSPSPSGGNRSRSGSRPASRSGSRRSPNSSPSPSPSPRRLSISDNNNRHERSSSLSVPPNTRSRGGSGPRKLQRQDSNATVIQDTGGSHRRRNDSGATIIQDDGTGHTFRRRLLQRMDSTSTVIQDDPIGEESKDPVSERARKMKAHAARRRQKRGGTRGTALSSGVLVGSGTEIWFNGQSIDSKQHVVNLEVVPEAKPPKNDI